MPEIDRRTEMASALTRRAPADVSRLLDSTRVVVRVGTDGPSVLAAAALVSMCARVVGQVFAPDIALLVRNPWCAPTLDAVIHASRVEPQHDVRALRTITLAVGPCDTAADIYVGGDDWTAVVSRRRPVAVGDCPLGGLGVQAAVALAFGELLKDLLGPIGMRHVRIDGELTWNLFDGGLFTAGEQRLGPITEPLVALLGCGSIGSSVAALLSLTPVTGTVDIVDADWFSPRRNSYRCPGVPANECGAKCEWVERTLGAAGWVTRSHQCTVAAWTQTRSEPGYRGIALLSVDNVDGRRDATDLLAATTVSAGVSGAALHAHLHIAGDEFACAYCALVDATPARDQVDVYAHMTGLTGARIRALLDDELVSRDDVTTCVRAGRVPATSSEDLIGGRLADLLVRHYATVKVPSGANDGIVHDVSAPHVSWLAGVLLVAEVVKAAVGLPHLDRRVEVDLTGVPTGGWRKPRRDPTGRCPCTSPAREMFVRDLYGP